MSALNSHITYTQLTMLDFKLGFFKLMSQCSTDFIKSLFFSYTSRVLSLVNLLFL